MGEQAKVADLETIERFRADLVKAAETFDLALSEAQSEVDRFELWIESQRPDELRRQIRRTEDEVAMCRTALFNKQEIKATPEARPSVVDERKALDRAQRRLTDLNERLRLARRWAVALPGQVAVYRAGLAPMRMFLDRDAPRIVAMMRRMLEHLEEYRRGDIDREGLLAMLAPPDTGDGDAVPMARAGAPDSDGPAPDAPRDAAGEAGGPGAPGGSLPPAPGGEP